MTHYISAIAIILFLFAGWLAIQTLSRGFAARHPELGTYREEGHGCGDSCSCTDKCTSSQQKLSSQTLSSQKDSSQNVTQTLHFYQTKGDHHE